MSPTGNFNVFVLFKGRIRSRRAQRAINSRQGTKQVGVSYLESTTMLASFALDERSCQAPIIRCEAASPLLRCGWTLSRSDELAHSATTPWVWFPKYLDSRNKPLQKRLYAFTKEEKVGQYRHHSSASSGPTSGETAVQRTNFMYMTKALTERSRWGSMRYLDGRLHDAVG